MNVHFEGLLNFGSLRLSFSRLFRHVVLRSLTGVLMPNCIYEREG